MSVFEYLLGNAHTDDYDEIRLVNLNRLITNGLTSLFCKTDENTKVSTENMEKELEEAANRMAVIANSFGCSLEDILK